MTAPMTRDHDLARSRRPSSAAVGLAGIVTLTIPLAGVALRRLTPDLYYRMVQEDAGLEWATFFAFLGAALLFLGLAWERRRRAGAISWFPLLVALFCAFVAGEEISWGQRLLGLSPGEYLAEHNLQQEISLHNLAGASAQDLAFAAVALGYGLLLPLGERLGATRRLLRRCGAEAPPTGLAVGVVALPLIQLLGRDITFLEEWNELALGFSLLAAAALRLTWRRPAVTVAGLAAVLAALGAVAGGLAEAGGGHDPVLVARAHTELAALRADLRSGELVLSCELHKRLRDYQRATGHRALVDGAFRSSAAERASPLAGEQFLDPWNMPYWIVARCPTDGLERSVLIYSTGPNRRRDSTRWTIGGDDIALTVLGSEREPDQR